MKRNMKIAASTLLLALMCNSVSAQQAPDATLDVLPRWSDAFVLTPASPSVSRPIVIDHARVADIRVAALSQELDVALISPKHERYQVGQTRSGFDSFVVPVQTIGANYHAVLTGPVPGTWTVEVSGKKLTGNVDVFINAFLDSPLFLSMLAGANDYRAGDVAAVSLAAFDGTTPLQALQIDATLIAPDQSFLAVIFRDDGMEGDVVSGDGVYTALVTLLHDGQYAVRAVVEGIAGGVPFKRIASTLMQAQLASARFGDSFTDHASDTDGNGVVDQIVVAPAVIVSEAGTYAITVRLATTSGKLLQKRRLLTLSAGSAAPEVSFEAEEIREALGEDGPYQVKLMILERQQTTADVFNDRRIDAGLTQTYHLSALQRPHLRITGPFTATPVDQNGNSRFDELRIDVQLETDVAGTYSFSAGLSASDGTQLGDAVRDGTLQAGVNTVMLSFDGGPIGQHALDGPYTVHFTVFGPSPSLGGDVSFVTPRFVAWAFEGFVPDTTAPVLAVSVDPTVLWPADHRMVEIHSTIQVSDNRDPAPRVEIESISSDEGANWLGDGNTSPDIQVAGGVIFLRAERSGNDRDRHYVLVWRARDQSGNIASAAAMVVVPHDQK